MTDRQITVSDDREGARIERARREAFGVNGAEILRRAAALHQAYLDWLTADQMVETNKGLDGDAREKWRRERGQCASRIWDEIGGTVELMGEARQEGFERGQRDATRRWAWWKDGVQYVGCGNYTLGNAMERFVGEEFRG